MRGEVPIDGGSLPVLADDELTSSVAILGHGAGSHMEHRTMEWLAGIVRQCGLTPVRFNFLYRVLGKSMPDRMPVCVSQYRAVIDSVREQMSPERLFIGGHSFGGRVASMLEAEGKAADGLMLFSYPLHPPGQPDKLRDAHLKCITTPTLQFNGTNDEFCTREIMDGIAAGLDPSVWRLKWIEGADHSYSVKKSSGNSRKQVEQVMVQAIQRWMGERVMGGHGRNV